MIPAKFDLDLYRGDSYGWRFILWADAARTTAFPLTGATVTSQIRDKPSGFKIVAVPCVVTLPNTIDITITPEISRASPSKGVWDLEIVQADGQVQTPIGGIVTVTADVTSLV